MFGRATIRLGIGPHSSFMIECSYIILLFICRKLKETDAMKSIFEKKIEIVSQIELRCRLQTHNRDKAIVDIVTLIPFPAPAESL